MNPPFQTSEKYNHYIFGVNIKKYIVDIYINCIIYLYLFSCPLLGTLSDVIYWKTILKAYDKSIII